MTNQAAAPHLLLNVWLLLLQACFGYFLCGTLAAAIELGFYSALAVECEQLSGKIQIHLNLGLGMSRAHG